jgi:SMC interacting uncharacterized protein involved in chromosome segregation
LGGRSACICFSFSRYYVHPRTVQRINAARHRASPLAGQMTHPLEGVISRNVRVHVMSPIVGRARAQFTERNRLRSLVTQTIAQTSMCLEGHLARKVREKGRDQSGDSSDPE